MNYHSGPGSDINYHYGESNSEQKAAGMIWFYLQIISICLGVLICAQLWRNSEIHCHRRTKITVMILYVFICGLNIMLFDTIFTGVFACEEFVCDILKRDTTKSGDYSCSAKWAITMSTMFWSCLLGLLSTIFASIDCCCCDRNKVVDERKYVNEVSRSDITLPSLKS